MTAKHASRQNQDVSDRDTQVFPFRAEAWIAGTMGLTFEERGFYIAIIAAMWSRKGPIPADQLAITLRCDPRQARRLLDRLIAHGKLTLDADNRVYNSHVMAKLQVTLEPATSGELPADFPEKSGRSPGEVREKSGNIFPKNAEKSTKPRARVIDNNSLSFPTKVESANALSSSAPPSDVPVLEAFQAWNAMALRCGLPQASRLTPKRKTQIRARIREHGPDSWATALANVERSKFLRGIDRDWRASLDFLLQPSSFAKVVEGTYGNGAHADEPPPDPVTAAQSKALLEQALAELGEVH